LNRILLVNPETFSWRQGTALEDVQVTEVLETGSVYGSRVRSWENWKKLLTGKADIRRISKRLLLRFTLALAVMWREVLRFLHIRSRGDLGWELQRIAARGIQTSMVFSRGEPGIELLRMQAGSDIGRLGDRLRVRIIENADHIFSRSASRAVLQEVLSEELFRRSELA
jgi:hypothetical protein